MVESQVPRDLLYTREHHWIRIEGDVATFGLTDHAQNELGDVVLVTLPEVGQEVHAAEEAGEIESVKTTSDFYAPVSGTVVEVNEDLEKRPQLVNEDPYGEGWLIRVNLSDPSDAEELLTAEDYGHLVEEGD